MLRLLISSLALASTIGIGSYADTTLHVPVRGASTQRETILQRGLVGNAVAVTIGNRNKRCQIIPINAVTVVDALTGNQRGLTLHAKLNGRLVGRTATINAQDFTATIDFPTALRVPSCAVNRLSFTLESDATAVSGSRHQFILELPTDLITDENLEWQGAFPFRGPVITVR